MWRSCMLIAAGGIALPLIVQGGRDSTRHECIEASIARWSSKVPQDRARASEVITDGWAIWTEEEMQALRRTRRHPDPEIASRARTALASIERHRRWGLLADRVDELLAEMRTSREPASWHVWSRPGNLDVECCQAAIALMHLGPEAEPLLLEHLSERKLLGAIAVILERIGSERCLAPLIEALPGPGPPQLGPESPSMLILYALQSLTHAPPSVDLCRLSAYPIRDELDLREEWRRWHEANRNYLFTDSHFRDEGEARICVDSEAKAAGIPRCQYRRGRRELAFEEVQSWADSPEFAARLREFCVTLLLRHLYPAGRPDELALQSLAWLNDARATGAIERLLAAESTESQTARTLSWIQSVRNEATDPGPRRVETVSEERLAHLRRWLRDSNRSARLQAAVRLCELGCEEGVPALRGILGEGPMSYWDSLVVDTACRELPTNPHPEAIELFQRALGDRLGTLGRPDTIALAIQGHDESIQKVAERLRHGETRLIESDFRGLSVVERIGGRRLIPDVLPLLAAEERNMRVHAARTIVLLLDSGH